MAQRHLNKIQNSKQLIDAAEANFTELYTGGGGGTVKSATINSTTVNPDSSGNLALGSYATSSDFSDLTAKVPTAASSSNQLADKDFVNSSINSVTAFYITKNAAGDQFNSKAELDATSVFYSGGAVRVPTRNDYCIVLSDESKRRFTEPLGYASFTTTTQYIGLFVDYNSAKTIVTTENKDILGIVPGTTIAYDYDTPTTRYIYQNSQWEFQYVINETALTAAQLAAVNSGITSTLVGKITANETAIANAEASRESAFEEAVAEAEEATKNANNAAQQAASVVLAGGFIPIRDEDTGKDYNIQIVVRQGYPVLTMVEATTN